MSLTAKIINKVRHYRLELRAGIHTTYMYSFSRLYGIKLGSGCRFWKQPVIYLEIGSTFEIGDGCVFRSDFDSNLIGVSNRCIISTHSPNAVIKIGSKCGFSGTSIGIKESLEIGNNVLVGANSYITDFDWHSLDPMDRDNPANVRSKKVIIEDNVWIGLNCIILKGVRIGRNSIIGAGSVVSKDIPPDTISGGNPCRIIRSINNDIDSKQAVINTSELEATEILQRQGDRF
jgi:acetyltransferase-like isoleucine patch superfamily enzyme